MAVVAGARLGAAGCQTLSRLWQVFPSADFPPCLACYALRGCRFVQSLSVRFAWLRECAVFLYQRLSLHLFTFASEHTHIFLSLPPPPPPFSFALHSLLGVCAHAWCVCGTLQARVCGRKIPEGPPLLPCPVTTSAMSERSRGFLCVPIAFFHPACECIPARETEGERASVLSEKEINQTHFIRRQ